MCCPGAGTEGLDARGERILLFTNDRPQKTERAEPRPRSGLGLPSPQPHLILAPDHRFTCHGVQVIRSSGGTWTPLTTATPDSRPRPPLYLSRDTGHQVGLGLPSPQPHLILAPDHRFTCHGVQVIRWTWTPLTTATPDSRPRPPLYLSRGTGHQVGLGLPSPQPHLILAPDHRFTCHGLQVIRWDLITAATPDSRPRPPLYLSRGTGHQVGLGLPSPQPHLILTPDHRFTCHGVQVIMWDLDSPHRSHT
ncbi:hypothetical protein J6590_068581 [Homalodisca vitripennis]|nr:hypothetical protein J6590_068581 [Homalodisca vitripennis]